MAVAIAPDETETSGYQRIVRQEDPNAVSWWFVVREKNGRVFARGGRCRTSKLARSLIYTARSAARRERQELAGGR